MVDHGVISRPGPRGRADDSNATTLSLGAIGNYSKLPNAAALTAATVQRCSRRPAPYYSNAATL
jgi:hypothetical protein